MRRLKTVLVLTLSIGIAIADNTNELVVSTCAPVVSRDGDEVCLALGDSRGHDADPEHTDQLDTDPGAGVGRLQVVDELCQVLDRVDVVVGRGRDESHVGDGVSRGGDLGAHFVVGQLPALARLRT